MCGQHFLGKPMRNRSAFSFFLLCLAFSGSTYAAALRVTCEGNDVGAEVLVNGKFRGECPVDLSVPNGALKLLVRKQGEGGRERVFEQEIRMSEGSAKKVEANLGPWRLSPAEVQRQDEKVKRLYALPLDQLEKQARSGDPDAMVVLARSYSGGIQNRPIDKVVGLAWWQKAAEAGNVTAMYNLSLMNHMGTPEVPKNPAQARIWLVKASEAGLARATESLASELDTTDRSQANQEEIFRMTLRAAEQGSPSSMLRTGSAYSSGTGTPRNLESAVLWWRRAAEAGNQYAMFELANSYEKGQGVAANHEQAVFWWRKAAELQNGFRNEKAVEELKKRGLL